MAKNYGISDANVLAEIKRKADAGIALSNKTYQSAYDSYLKDKAATSNKQTSSTPKQQTPQAQYPTMPEFSPVQQAQKPTVPRPQTSQFNQKSYLNNWQSQTDDMYNQLIESRVAQLRAQRDKAVGEVNQQKAEVAPQYQALRNQTDVVNMQNVQRLREAMANAGLTSSGENVTAQVAQNNARQNSLNALNLQEQQAMNDFDRRIADLMNPDGENALIAQLEAERSRARLDLGMRAEEMAYSRSRDSLSDDRYYTDLEYRMGRDAVEDGRYLNEQQYRQYQDALNEYWNNTQWNYNVGRDQVADDRYNQEWDYQKQLDELSEAWRQREWSQLSPAERQAAELDFEFYKKKDAYDRANAVSRGGYDSPGGGSPSGSTTQSNLSQAYQQYQQAKTQGSKTPLDQYYEQQEKIFKPSVVRKEPVYPIPSIGMNPNLSNYDRLQMMKQQYGIR